MHTNENPTDASLRATVASGGKHNSRCFAWVGLVALVVAVTGCGVSFNTLPTVTLSPPSVSWHKVDIGNTSGQKIITVTNTSPAKAIPLTISSINLSENFIETADTCPIAPQLLAPGASCTISVAFRPQGSGTLTGTLSLTDNATNTPSTVALSALGGVGFLLFDPTSLDFSGVAASTVSQPQTATLTNEGTTPVTIAAITPSAHFSEGDNCPVSPNTLAPGGSCTVTVTSNPVASGAVTGAINVKDNFGNITQLYLSGSDQGRQAVGALGFTPSSLVWGKVAVGGTSAAKTITVTNTQSASVSFSNIATGRDYTITASTCPLAPATLGGGQTCTVSIAFRPGTAGPITELLTFTDNAQGSPQALALNGTGIVGDMLFAPTAISFAGVDPGQVSPAQTATLTNETQNSLNLASVTISSHFAQTNNCPPTLGPQASCTFEVTANPTSDGTFTGSVNVKDSLGNSAQLYLKGQGGNTDKVLSFSPNPMVWGTLDIGQTSGAKVLTVDNGQTVPLTIYSISISQDFIETASTCQTAPSTVAAGASCTISLAFRPLSAGAKSEVITFTDDAPGGNQSVSLRGTGAVGPLLFQPASLVFAGVNPNTASQAQTATLTNEQASSITLASISLSGHFVQTNDCPGTLAPSASCTVTVTSNPVIDGPTNGSVNVTDGSGATTQLYLSGMGGIPIDSGSSGSNEKKVSPSSLFPGAGEGIPDESEVRVLITPQGSCVEPMHNEQLTATVSSTSNSMVDWYVDGVRNGTNSSGVILADGMYLAPSISGTHMIKAVSQADQSASSFTNVVVTNTPEFSIYPSSASLPPGGQHQFQLQVCGVPDTDGVTYSVDGIDGGNAAVGEITTEGIYTAPSAAGKHVIKATDRSLNTSSSAAVTVFSGVTVDFGSRTNHNYPIPAGMLGASHIDDLHSPGDMEILSEAGLKLSRTEALIPQVYATQKPDWSKIDQRIANLQAEGMHVVLQVVSTPPWLQPKPNPCGAGSTAVIPADVQAWARIAASYVAHMDASFPGVVTDYEIWNQPDTSGLCGSDKLGEYESLYAAAAPLMKKQAAEDGVSIRVGGPATASPNSEWISALLSDAATAPYVDFVSYHNLMQGSSQAGATWDTYNGTTPVYQITQGTTGAAAAYSKVAGVVAAGKQPGGARTPIYIDGYKTSRAAAQDCCRNDPTYSPVSNALYVSDLLDSVYSGTAAVPGRLIYPAANAYPYFCLLGTWDASMDCAYSPGSLPVPYPQYYTYQLLASPNYLDLNSGGYMAASITPPVGAGSLAVTAFYTEARDSILIVNPTSTSYPQITITAQKIGLGAPQAIVYQIVNGNQIISSSLPLTASGSSYTGTISIPQYSVMAVAIVGQ